MWRAIKKMLGLPTEPTEPTEPEKAAREAFRKSHPNDIMWTTLAADESTRFVVGVFYAWDGKPPRYRFYAVEKATLAAAELQDDAAYRPKNWR